jgi:hypothetical protein
MLRSSPAGTSYIIVRHIYVFNSCTGIELLAEPSPKYFLYPVDTSLLLLWGKVDDNLSLPWMFRMLEALLQCHRYADIMCLITCTRKVTVVNEAVRNKISIFCVNTPCSPLKVNGFVGRTCRLYLQSRRIIQARNKREAGLWRWRRRRFPPKRLLTFKWTTRRYIHHNHRCENLKS